MERILVGLDGSPREPLVLHTALDLARRVGARLFLYRAVAVPRELPPMALSMAPSDVGALLERLAHEQLLAAARDVPKAMLGGTRVTMAIPWQGVCEAARHEHAELIVIGSHGYAGFDRLLGTTAAKIVNHSEISVLVVKAELKPQ